jgi:hypothetical protein
MALAAVGLTASARAAGAARAAEEYGWGAGVEGQLAGQLGGRRPLAVRQLVQHPGLGQGERGFEIALAQETDLLGVEPVEASNDRDPLFGLRLGHPAHLPPRSIVG